MQEANLAVPAAANGSSAKLEPFFQPCYNTAEPYGEDC
jgi:hypothetical protein